MLIPKFKLNYLQPSQRATMKDLLIRAVLATIAEQEPPPPLPLSSSCDPADDSLFSFMSQTAADNTASTILSMTVIAESEGKRNRRWKVDTMINRLLINSKCDNGVLFCFVPCFS